MYVYVYLSLYIYIYIYISEPQVCVGGNKLGPFNTQCAFYDFSHCRLSEKEAQTPDPNTENKQITITHITTTRNKTHIMTRLFP